MEPTVRKSLLATLLGTAALGLVACAHDKPAADPVGASEPPGETQVTSGVVAPAARAQPSPNLDIAPSVLDACKIDINDVQTAPKFDFDDDAISPDERSVLHKVAACLTTGPLAGKSLLLVGRADPRGEDEYNMALGEKRSDAVKKYLTSDGVDAGRLDATSRGKLDATGTDDQGWARDRRVDLLIKP